MRGCARSRAFTLVELMFAMGLAALLGLVLSQMLASSLRLYAKGQARANLQAAGLMALSHLGRDLRSAAGATVSVWQAPEGDVSRAVAAVSCRPDERAGEISPYAPSQQHVIVFLDRRSGRLIRTTRPVEGTGVRLSERDLRDACEVVQPDERVICAHVSGLKPSLEPTGIDIGLALEHTVRDGIVAHETVQTHVAFRNRL